MQRTDHHEPSCWPIVYLSDVMNALDRIWFPFCRHIWSPFAQIHILEKKQTKLTIVKNIIFCEKVCPFIKCLNPLLWYISTVKLLLKGQAFVRELLCGHFALISRAICQVTYSMFLGNFTAKSLSTGFLLLYLHWGVCTCISCPFSLGQWEPSLIHW